MEIDIIEGAKVLIVKHYKAFTIYLFIYILAFEDITVFVFKLQPLFQKSEVYSKCL